MGEAGYLQEVQEWRAGMDAELRAEDGWLSFVGLYWLKHGNNTLGSSSDCDIVLPRQAPRLLGAIKWEGAEASLQLSIGETAEVNGAQVSGPTPLKAADGTPPSVITLKALRMVIVRDADRVGLRVWDNLQPRDMPPRTWFEVDEKYRVKAQYTPYPAPVRVEMPNAKGEIESGYVQGYVSFKVAGKSCNLDAAELEDGRLYLQFSDLTRETRTYPFGRYLYSEGVSEDGRVVVDFNKAYNPPSAFKQLAPCTYAPGGNHLKVAIEAGELYSAPPKPKGTLTL